MGPLCRFLITSFPAEALYQRGMEAKMKRIYIMALLLITAAILIACSQPDTGTQAGGAYIGTGCAVQ